MADNKPNICPCGSGQTYDVCCAPIIKGEVKANTAESLMRARYTAYVYSEIDFILKTILPKPDEKFDEKGIRRWSEKSEWVSLEIVQTQKGGPDDDTGSVEFIANYRQKEVLRKHHEMASFKKNNGDWLFDEGVPVTPDTYTRSEPKVGRNDPCTCGSGKKYKKCCGKA